MKLFATSLAIVACVCAQVALAGKKQKKHSAPIKAPLTHTACHQVPVPQSIGKTRVEYRTEVFDCSYVEVSQECNPVPQTIEKTCFAQDFKLEVYDCSETSYDVQCTQVAPALPAKKRRLGSKKHEGGKSPIRPTAQCKQIPVRIKKDCTRQIPIQKPYPCNDTVVTPKCTSVQHTIQKQCSREVPIQVPFTETITTFRTECHDIPPPKKL